MTVFMGCYLLAMLAYLIMRKRWIAALEALDAPPNNTAAQRYRSGALCFFLAFSALLLVGALANTIAGGRTFSEVIGWSGLGCLPVCAFFVFRYAAVNKKPKYDEWDLA